MGVSQRSTVKKLTAAGMLITLGIVYGDIGTSPLYVMSAIVNDNGGLKSLSRDYILGSLSLIFWTLMLLTTIKYVLIALRATNNGEGGIFALYTLVRHKAHWLIYPALIGGAALLADGMLTPAVTVTTSIEGLKGVQFGEHILVHDQATVMWVTIAILSLIFIIQRFGTEKIGSLFGPIMFGWFAFIGIVGLIHLLPDLSILQAISPIYAIKVLFDPQNHTGIFILGNVFLATTGAEALYSDVGHVGRKNIYVTWPFVYLCLMLNYFGQGVYLLNSPKIANGTVNNPFFDLLPGNWRTVGIVLATLAAIIASQALITGSYTLVAEAIRLKFMPRLQINYPTLKRGQLYVPAVNSILWAVCLAIVLYFRTSEHMEAAYGLAITATMLMTTLLLFHFLALHHVNPVIKWLFGSAFVLLESTFFIASLVKFTHGGYVTVIIAGVILMIMYAWYYGNSVKNAEDYSAEYVSLPAYKRQLVDLSHDDSVPIYADNLVYLTNMQPNHHIKKEVLYSILDKRPKRAQVYWFVNVQVTDEPYTSEYTIHTLDTDDIVEVQLYLGFRMSQRVNFYMRQIVQEMIQRGELEAQPQKYTTIPNRNVGDFCFVLIREELSPETQISGYARALIRGRLFLQRHTSSPAEWFGLEYADVREETVPLRLGKQRIHKIKYIKKDDD